MNNELFLFLTWNPGPIYTGYQTIALHIGLVSQHVQTRKAKRTQLGLLPRRSGPPQSGYRFGSISEAVDAIRELAHATSDMLLYQSSCGYHRSFQETPFGGVILCRDGFRCNERHGKVFLIQSDNNALLGMLFNARVKVKYLVCIRDGCMEGGNYECTNTSRHFGKLLPILHDHFFVVTDHGTDQGFFDIPVHAQEIGMLSVFEPFIARSHPSRPCILWEAKKQALEPVAVNFGKIRVFLRRDSIFNHIEYLDALFITTRMPRGYMRYFGIEGEWRGLEESSGNDLAWRMTRRRPLELNEHLYRRISWRGTSTSVILTLKGRVGSLSHLLAYAETHRVRTVGVTPCARGRYQRILREIEDHQGDYPSEIHMFHLHKDDYKTLYEIAGAR
jgi:hypothetical protein